MSECPSVRRSFVKFVGTFRSFLELWRRVFRNSAELLPAPAANVILFQLLLALQLGTVGVTVAVAAAAAAVAAEATVPADVIADSVTE